ncbi:MAG TPA: SAM-dependent methyltransferase [Phycisphaerales bacterium]|nr:SAM-dependent methyltransferase [Phycisphaerales bacterium]
MSKDPTNPYVSRGGLKLRHALDEFKIDVTGLTCADLGASTGGFTDCLLQAGAAKVYSVDTAYGEFAWKLRNDPRVVLMERTNALHAGPPAGGVDLVVVDLGWTPQRLLVPAALKWLRTFPSAMATSSSLWRDTGAPPPSHSHEDVAMARKGRIISLIKPHYEAPDLTKGAPKGILTDEQCESITQRVVAELPSMGVRVAGLTRSPVLGGSKGKGNAEWLVVLEPS